MKSTWECCWLTTITFIWQWHLRHFCLRDVLVRRKKQHNLTFLVFNWHNIQEAPKRSPCERKWTSVCDDVRLTQMVSSPYVVYDPEVSGMYLEVFCASCYESAETHNFSGTFPSLMMTLTVDLIKRLPLSTTFKSHKPQTIPITQINH